MRIGYVDCFAGASGDMFLGALVDAGVPEQVLQDATAALNIGAGLRFEKVDRSGISCTKVHVLEGGGLAEKVYDRDGKEREQDVLGNQVDTGETVRSLHPLTQHMHRAGYAHTHAEEIEEGESGHGHGRSLTVIRELIYGAPLDAEVKATAIRAFELLGRSEAKIHNVPVEEIHFHEVGAVDAIVDIVAASAGIHYLRIGAWYCSPVNVGGGMVRCAHGNFPVPAPATADLLRGCPTYSAHVQKELVTPTGAALLRALEPTFGQQPAMRVEMIGYGAGTRNPEGFPNVLRLSVGQSEAAAVPLAGGMPLAGVMQNAGVAGSETLESAAGETGFDGGMETVTVLETALDDLSPQVIAYVAERALAMGALDAMLTPVVMKKGRPGTLITVLCHAEQSAALQQLLLRETSTLGVRVRQERRVCLARSHRAVMTAYGSIRIKVGSDGGEERNAAPEFEDCRAAAKEHDVALKVVQQAAMAAYVQAR